MSGTDDLTTVERRIIASASHVSGRVWVLVLHIPHAERLVEKGYMTRIGRSAFRLTDKGFDVKLSGKRRIIR